MPGAKARLAPSPSSAGGDADIASIGILVADQTRCRMLFALADGRALPASRLAAEAEISAATASSHLRKLTESGLLKVETKGRFRHYRLAGPDVANLIEALERLAPTLPVRSLAQSQRARAWREARSCYDHLAGRVAVELMRSMVNAGHLEATGQVSDRDGSVQYAISDHGFSFLNELGVQVPEDGQAVHHHVDSTEMSSHLSGALGSALFGRLTALQWIERSTGSRTVRITESGGQGLHQRFGISFEAR
jgi:DNA-binding transcriptional ArsR family regulator